MYTVGATVKLTEQIDGKNDSFHDGLEGTIVEKFDLPHGKSYRIQFLDGRVARFPEELMDQAVEVVTN